MIRNIFYLNVYRKARMAFCKTNFHYPKFILNTSVILVLLQQNKFYYVATGTFFKKCKYLSGKKYDFIEC